MNNYIVFDLEWNQSAHGKSDSLDDFPFEIIEIGAVKLEQNFCQISEFHRLICPRIYTQMHYAISEVTHMKMRELREYGDHFEQAVEDFRIWCGDNAVYCTWGPMDLTELQRNMKFFQVQNWLPKPLFYYDIQKLYGLLYKNGAKLSLDAAVEELGLQEERPFHRALDDAYYTGKIFSTMVGRHSWAGLEPYISVDYYRLPQNGEEEIRLHFPRYSKYVSRAFLNREDAMKDRMVTELRCYQCNRALRKKIRWFSPNQKIYYALGICPEHGFMKGKIRMKHITDAEIFVVKTVKQTDKEEAEKLRIRKENMSKRRSERNKAKRCREAEKKEERK